MSTENSNRHILLVENESIIALDLTKKLRSWGYGAEYVLTGKRSLEVIASGTQIDLIIMDIDLGKGMDGTEAAREILKKHNVPIIFLTSHTEKEMVEKVRGIKYYGFVLKSTGDFVLQSLIEMAFDLFETHHQVSEREEFYHTIVEHASEAIILTNQKGMIIQANKLICSMLDYRQDEMISMSISDFFSEEDIKSEPIHFKEIFDFKTVRSQRRIKKKDGTFIEVEISGRLLPNGYIHALIRDLSDYKKSYDELQKELAEKNQLFREMQHRIKNNMATIRSLFNIQLTYLKNPEACAVLEKVISRLMTMEVLYTQVYKNAEFTQLNINEYLSQLIEDLRSTIAGSAYILIEQKIENLKIDVHHVLPLGIIFEELFSNVLLHAYKADEYGRMEINLRSQESNIILEIKDNGQGIKDDNPNGEGKGFGLSLVELLVQQLDGTMEMVNDHGTKVTIVFKYK
ncbi:MAG: PAS domain S-box protein [Spirochaetales bacterium]|nr:PAS domain S-box protein [Spirochaetales bacterium]